MKRYSKEIMEKIDLIKEIIISRSILRNIRDDIKWEIDIVSDSHGENIHEIPTLIERKRIIKLKERQRHSMNYSRFTIKSIGKGEFYGWQIDKNERFLLGNFIVTHNSRLQGGDDSASERYIFTLLNSLTRYIFPEADDAVLKYINDDGTIVEPEFYAPIIPFALVNGISGIGTGFSCNIAPYNPKQIIGYLKDKLKGQTNNTEFVPYYEGFKGTINKIAEQKYLIKGLYEKIGDDKKVDSIFEMKLLSPVLDKKIKNFYDSMDEETLIKEK